MAASKAPRQITPLLILDQYALFYLGLLFIAGFAVALLAHGYLGRLGGQLEEFYLVLLLATAGGAALVMSAHFVSFLSGAGDPQRLFVRPDRVSAQERARRRGGYQISDSCRRVGCFPVVRDGADLRGLGTMEFAQMASGMAGGDVRQELLLIGQAMIFVGVGFKLAVAPFHVWAPDVYEGAPAPVTAFIATVSRRGFALLVRYFANLGYEVVQPFFPALAAIAVASMFVGNLLALAQTNVKRILAYSSIAHMGYLLVAFLAGGKSWGYGCGLLSRGIFRDQPDRLRVVTILSGRREADEIEDYLACSGVGPGWRRPSSPRCSAWAGFR